MKIANTVFLAALLALSLACSYSSKANMPATAGMMPAIAALSPVSMNAGGQGFVLTVNGSNFSGNAAINWNNTAMSTTWMGTGQVMATIPAAAIANAGMVMVTVTNPGTAGSMGMYGGGTMAATSNSMTFTIN
jgi:IPT/TIG domain